MTVDVTTGDGNVVEQDTHSGFDVAKYNDDGRLMWRPRCSRTGDNPYNAGAILSLAEQKFQHVTNNKYPYINCPKYQPNEKPA